MKCSEVKSNLPLYSDDILTSAERAELDSHLDTCPLCRQSLSEFQSIKNDLRSLVRPNLSGSALANLRSVIAAELTPSFAGPTFRLVDERRNWLETWMLPSTVGTFASIVFGVFMLWAILSTARDPSEFIADSSAGSRSSTILASNRSLGPDALDLSPSEYANTRLAFAGESPSVNPQGALVALTRSLVRGEMEDEEVVIVADVFGNGLARIAEVVEPPADDRAFRQLEKALESDPVYAPFVPASFDGRSENMRVILKIQNVNVKTSLTEPKRPTVRSRRS
jgi:Putative zinc-finger